MKYFSNKDKVITYTNIVGTVKTSGMKYKMVKSSEPVLRDREVKMSQNIKCTFTIYPEGK